jgi:predicted acylesterase/phospholipase RssA
VLNNLPADVMRARFDGRLFAFDASPGVDLTVAERSMEASMSGWPQLLQRLNPFDHRAAFPGILQILGRTAVLSSLYGSDRTRALADCYIHPPTEPLDSLAWGQVEPYQELGYRAALPKLSEFVGHDVARKELI